MTGQLFTDLVYTSITWHKILNKEKKISSDDFCIPQY